MRVEVGKGCRVKIKENTEKSDERNEKEKRRRKRGGRGEGKEGQVRGGSARSRTRN